MRGQVEYPFQVVSQQSEHAVAFQDHFHNSYEIIYVQKGQIQCTINELSYLVNENSLIFINNMEKHNVKVLKYPYKRYFMLIKPDFFKAIIDNPILSSVFNNRSANFSHVLSLDAGGINEINEMIEKTHDELKEKRDFWESAVKLYLHQLMIYLYRNYRMCFPLVNYSDSMQIIIDMQKYIEEHLLEPISLGSLSKRYFRNMYYLSHLFHKTTGYTFIEYLCQQRISKAKDLLYHTDASITRVCQDAGFNNVNHFIRIFKKYEKTTPYQYRQKFRRRESLN